MVRCAICGQASKVRTVCVKSARTDLCGGCRVTGIPTATRVENLLDTVRERYESVARSGDAARKTACATGAASGKCNGYFLTLP